PAVPATDDVARVRLVNLERKERFRTERVLHLLVGHERRRPAELAPLPDAGGVEHGDRLTALTANPDLRGLPPPRRIGQAAKRRGERVLDDDGRRAARFERGGRFRSAERTNELLFGRIPVRLGAAGRAMELFARDSFSRAGCEIAHCDEPGSLGASLAISK